MLFCHLNGRLCVCVSAIGLAERANELKGIDIQEVITLSTIDSVSSSIMRLLLKLMDTWFE